ncbi:MULTISPECIES: cytochrome b5 domain-containing protein [unclassified Clostridium]|uniref:cytochrome b5 domain-containing protein n=1 Tax=unclassified Clostridium TaxID=2614128 RepID=UPI0002973400|nr:MULTISPECIES: cytochrome b5 domain-containing protein [unclassified Clostridium]EKQ51495.1 MAG: putative heme/steroid binding protein [Clostridium sp. Maddingley MBC34-26]
MSIYFDFETIKSLIGDDYYREQKLFTLEELAQYNGHYGKPAYAAVKGIIYDLSNEAAWAGGAHFGLVAGKDLTEEFNSCHGMDKILKNLPKVGVVGGSNKQLTRTEIEATYEFSPNDWVRYITPAVNDALEEANAGVNLEHLFQKYILAGVLIGQGRTPEEAVSQVDVWEQSGISTLLNQTKGK